MPHVVYIAAAIACPWPGCNFQIELVDFQLEKTNDAQLYASVMAAWGSVKDFGLIGRCPGCHQLVLFGLTNKKCISDAAGLPVLPDDWHQKAYIA